jgi:5'-deoxynucleotidase YfbR-like HD superfamily hydrolase
MENLYTPNCIRTFTGKYINIFEPDPMEIDISDIAHALSHQCRFGGHLPEYYSVAQHCVLVAEKVPQEYAMEALLHDASEAYLLDIPRPIKHRLTNYTEIEDKLMTVIAAKYGFQWPLNEVVKKADEKMLQYEWDRIMLQKVSFDGFKCWSPTHAKKAFKAIYFELQDRKFRQMFNE